MEVIAFSRYPKTRCGNAGLAEKEAYASLNAGYAEWREPLHVKEVII